jgi:hypothetical protein
MKSAYTVAGRRFRLERGAVEKAVANELPDPIRDHFVVVAGRPFPPKQVLSAVTGLDRADFTTHQARRILMRLGFTAGRRSRDTVQATADEERRRLPYGGRQAAALAPYVGKWVALGEPTEVLVAAETPQEVLAWLAKHGRSSSGMFRVPATERETEGLAPL